MKKFLNKYMLLALCLCVVFATELFLLLDGIVVYNGGMLPFYTPVFMVPATAVLLFACFRNHWKRALVSVLLIPVTICLFAGLGYLGWKSFSDNAAYENTDSGKHRLYADRSVMVIVPHQDDEINILGGVMEEYVRYGSEVRVVFLTNGDYYFPAETRLNEALAVCDNIGIPEENVIFLGYGNEWKEELSHIVNAEPDTVLESYAGRTETYGTTEHPAFREGRSYTRRHLEEDLADVILESRPDVIFCSDYDHHIDHKALTIMFEKVMGALLKENPEYTPVVYKGYAYGTAWEAEQDYYSDNIRATQSPFGDPYGQKPEVYRWEDRIRMPVAGDTLSRSLIGAPAYYTLALHDSQWALGSADRVINGDKVLWQRYTTSLVLHGDVAASSGRTDVLHDFMLIDNYNLVDEEHMPYDGVWIPEEADAVRTVSVTLAEKTDIASIVLYDHPSETDNVLNVLITFDDGTCVETGPLASGGSATAVTVNKKGVSSFSVSLTKTEGEQAGLSEIEAFGEEPEVDGRFVKLMDVEDNFAYDYLTPPDGMAEFTLYVHGNLPRTLERYIVEIDGEAGTMELDGNVVRVRCPEGKTVVLKVACSEANVADSVVIRNPGALTRGWMNFWKNAEEAFYSRLSIGVSNNLVVSRFWEKVSYVIDYM